MSCLRAKRPWETVLRCTTQQLSKQITSSLFVSDLTLLLRSLRLGALPVQRLLFGLYVVAVDKILSPLSLDYPLPVERDLAFSNMMLLLLESQDIANAHKPVVTKSYVS